MQCYSIVFFLFFKHNTLDGFLWEYWLHYFIKHLSEIHLTNIVLASLTSVLKTIHSHDLSGVYCEYEIQIFLLWVCTQEPQIQQYITEVIISDHHPTLFQTAPIYLFIPIPKTRQTVHSCPHQSFTTSDDISSSQAHLCLSIPW